MLLYMKRVSDAAGRKRKPPTAIGPASGRKARRPRLRRKDKPPTLHDKLLVTGHHLEWLALAPEEVQPPRETIVRAGQWLARTLVEMDQKELLEAPRPLHARRPRLCLWRSDGSVSRPGSKAAATQRPDSPTAVGNPDELLVDTDQLP